MKEYVELCCWTPLVCPVRRRFLKAFDSHECQRFQGPVVVVDGIDEDVVMKLLSRCLLLKSAYELYLQSPHLEALKEELKRDGSAYQVLFLSVTVFLKRFLCAEV